MRPVCIAALCLLLAQALCAAEPAPAFTSKPSAMKSGETIAIKFAVNRETDVAISVENAAGRIVRHLGGGMLGKNPPEPFKPGLSQAVEWDGKDDAGKSAVGGPFKARVQLGLHPSFDRYIGWKDDPPINDGIYGLAVASDHSVCVLFAEGAPGGQGRAVNRICAYSPEGKFLRTIYPFSSSLAPGKLSGVDFLCADPGNYRPRVYERVSANVLPMMRAIPRQTMATTSDNRLVLTSGWATELYGFNNRSLLVLNMDGSIPREKLDGPILRNVADAGNLHVAISPDDKFAYVCGFYTDRYPNLKDKLQHVVYRCGMGVSDKTDVFFGQMGKAGNGKDALNNPQGVATDSEGRVYISDFGNDRVVVAGADGKYQAEISVKKPTVLAVHPQSGAIYVVSAEGAFKLIKFTSIKDPRSAGELSLGSFGGFYRDNGDGNLPIIALDRFSKNPVIYIGSVATAVRGRLLRIDDENGNLKGTAILGAAPPGKEVVTLLPQGVDADGNYYLLNPSRLNPYEKVNAAWMYEESSGELKPWSWAKMGNTRYTVGKDNLLYSGEWWTDKTNGLTRVDKSGKPAPFSATGASTEVYEDNRFRMIRNNAQVLPNGNIWMLHFPSHDATNGALVSMFGPDGKIEKKVVVEGLQAPVGLRVDSRGNIFVGDGLKPADTPYPPEIAAFAKHLREKGTTPRGPHSEAVEDVYGESYGSILKFGPSGGKITTEGGGTPLVAYPGDSKFSATGLKGAYAKLSPMCPPRGMRFSACWCMSAWFDIDGFDRLFVPDALQFCVHVVDSNFNEITSFGEYGAAGDKNSGKGITFEFPVWVHTSDSAAYVVDAASCASRAIRVKLEYLAQESCALP